MNNTLQYFLSDFIASEDDEYSDTVIEYATMLTQENWQEIIVNLDLQKEDWKRGMLYLARYASLSFSRDLLIKGLYEWDDSQIMVSLTSIHYALKSELDSAKSQMKIAFEFSKNERSKITSSCAKFFSYSAIFPEFEELVQMLERKCCFCFSITTRFSSIKNRDI